MKKRTKLGLPPSQRVHDQGPWQEKVGIAVDMIAVLERHFHPELDRDAIAERVIGHARTALGPRPFASFVSESEVDMRDGRGPERTDVGGPAGILRVIVDYAEIDREDAEVESFVDVVQKALADLPEVSRWKAVMIKEGGPGEKPIMHLVKNPDFGRLRAPIHP